MMNRLFKISGVLLTYLIMYLSIDLFTGAYSIESFVVDNATRWEHYSPGSLTHMGATYTTYSYSSSEDKNKYGLYVTAGISMWGSTISCYEVNSSGMGTIMSSAATSNSNATTQPLYNPTTHHIVSWEMVIYSQNFDNRDENKKNRTIAHEIGHVYGLGHVDDSNYNTQIMSPDPYTIKNVTSYDLAGMNVMTHGHLHSGPYPTLLEQHSSYMHKARCTACLAYHLAQCVYTDQHSGMRHYLVVNCPCGNQHTESWTCTGNPCVLPFQSIPCSETE